MTPRYTARPLFEDFGCIVEPVHGTPFEELPRAELVHLFERHGAVLFRGFAIRPERVVACALRHSDTLLRMDAPARRDALDGSAAQVLRDYHGLPIPLHAENSYFFPQFFPEAMWFYCELPAERDGATTLCDGIGCFADFDAELRRTFLAQRLVYHLSVPRALLEHGINNDEGGGNIRAAIEALERGVPSVRHWYDSEGNLHAEVRRHAVLEARNGRDLAFVNHICSFLEPALVDEIRFEDGTPIGPRIMQRVRTYTERRTRRVPWQAEDLLWLDNRRIMHGRDGYARDSTRRLISVMTLRCNFAHGATLRDAAHAL
jgi:alpha-ketoglutarate-dependent taurine dioxygenase